MTDRIDIASRCIDAPPADIYRACSDPDALVAWLPPEDMTGEMLHFDFREGGGYRMRLRHTGPDHVPGKTSADADDVAVRLVRLEPDRCIGQSVTFDSSDPAFAGEMRIFWILDATDEGTRVTVRCENVPAGIRPEDHEAGLASSLANLAAFVEDRRPNPR